MVLSEQGYSLREVAGMLHKSTTFVTTALRNWDARRSLEDAPRSGRPKDLTPGSERLLVRQLNKNRGQTADELLVNTFGATAPTTPAALRVMLRKRGFRKRR